MLRKAVFLPLLRTPLATLLLFSLFLLIPFQRRFHGAVESWSRSLTLPDFPLPDFFSRKIHLFTSDFLIVGLALVLLYRLRVSFREFFWDGPSKYLTLLFFVLLLSTGTSISKSYSLQYLRLLEFSFIFLFFNAISCLREKIDLPKFIYRLAWLLFFLALFECAISVYQYFAQGSLGLKMLGEKNLESFRFKNPGEHLWIFGKALGAKPNPWATCRVSGTFAHPNILGGFLLCSVMASYYLYISATGKIKRLILQLAILLQFFTLYLSFSRSAMIALVFSTFLWFGLQLKILPNIKRMVFLGAVICCSALVGFVLLYPQIKTRGGIINYNSISKEADSERVVYMKAAANMIKEHPLLGVGYNNFQIYAHEEQSKYPKHHLHSKVHNTYLLIASEAGLIGGGLFLLFLGSVLISAGKGLYSNSSQEKAFLFSAFLGFLIIGCCDFYFLENPQGSILFFGIAGLLYAISKKIKHCQT